MEREAKVSIMRNLKDAYDRMLKKNDFATGSYEEFIEPLLAGVSAEDRYSISSMFYSEWTKSVRVGIKDYPYLGLAWYVHPWSTGS